MIQLGKMLGIGFWCIADSLTWQVCVVLYWIVRGKLTQIGAIKLRCPGGDIKCQLEANPMPIVASATENSCICIHTQLEFLFTVNRLPIPVN